MFEIGVVVVMLQSISEFIALICLSYLFLKLGKLTGTRSKWVRKQSKKRTTWIGPM